MNAISSFVKSLRKNIGPLFGSFGTGTRPPDIHQLGFDGLEATKAELGNWVLEGTVSHELERYLEQDYIRFLYTVYLVPDNDGRLLELGACPYFTTRLLKKTRNYELSLANYFGPTEEREQVHRLFRKDDPQKKEEFRFKIFDSEQEIFPYDSEYFDVVLFCEVLEHLVIDPVHTVYEINRVTKTGGLLVLTTPNVDYFENIRKLVLGQNIYDQYSGYGAYGRHNREYTLGEVQHLLTLHGFEIETSFTADVKPQMKNKKEDMLDKVIKYLTRRRKYDLGEYIFVRAKKVKPCVKKRSFVFYRSRPDIIQEY
jgi:SAM-dependent methyltransferase